MAKIHLLIQGPMVSNGVNGDRELSGHNCIHGIIDLIEEYDDSFETIIVSTWDSLINKSILKKFKIDINPKVKIIFSSSPKPIKRSGEWRINNKRLQFEGILNGLNYLIDQGFNPNDYVIKIRSDQSLNLSALIYFIENDIQADRVYVPHFVKMLKGKLMNFIPDFYFVSTLDKLHDFSISQISDIEFVNSLHQEIVYKYFHYIKPSEINNSSLYIRDWKIYKNQINIMKTMYFKIFFPLPESVMTSIIWRGKKYDYSSNGNKERYLFSESLEGKSLEDLEVLLDSELRLNIMTKLIHIDNVTFSKVRQHSKSYFIRINGKILLILDHVIYFSYEISKRFVIKLIRVIKG